MSADTVVVLAREGTVRAMADWQDAFSDALRRYHLHYLDQLGACAQPEPNFAVALLERWVLQNPPGSRPGWESYPTSRRLTNAIKASLAGCSFPATILASLADQSRYLLPRLEFHLLANHLLANAKALAFAGLFFEGVEADAWLRRAIALLGEELPEQLGADGGHFERSPMYHGLILEDLLDLLNLSRCFANAALAELVLPRCSAMLGWMAELLHPDQEVAFFNDTAMGVARPFGQLAAYGMRLGVRSPEANLSKSLCLLPSGFARLQTGKWCLLADVGGPAPGYQPGHAHAGTLSFELSHGCERVFVNTGVSTYEPGAIRTWERGSAAHNTLTIDAANSSEVWHSFRVGRRAKVTALAHGAGAQSAWVAATHDGYLRSRYRALHSRHWGMFADRVEIKDEVAGRGTPATELWLHLHPDCVAAAGSDGSISIVTALGTRLHLELDGQMSWRIDSYLYAPSFGVQRKASAIRGVAHLALPAVFRVRLTA